MTAIRPCRADERSAILEIVNAAAEAYRGVIPADCWHEPYMPRRELEQEIASGVSLWGYETGRVLAGVMGFQPVGDVELIRHAYVLPSAQGRGVGTALLEHLRARGTRPMLVGTWAAASWLSASIADTDSSSSRRGGRRSCSGGTGRSRSARSRRRSCSPTLGSRPVSRASGRIDVCG